MKAFPSFRFALSPFLYIGWLLLLSSYYKYSLSFIGPAISSSLCLVYQLCWMVVLSTKSVSNSWGYVQARVIDMCLQVANFSSGATCMLSVLMARNPLLYVYSETASDKSNVLQISYMHTSLLHVLWQLHWHYSAKSLQNWWGWSRIYSAWNPVANAKTKQHRNEQTNKKCTYLCYWQLCTPD